MHALSFQTNLHKFFLQEGSTREVQLPQPAQEWRGESAHVRRNSAAVCCMWTVSVIGHPPGALLDSSVTGHDQSAGQFRLGQRTGDALVCPAAALGRGCLEDAAIVESSTGGIVIPDTKELVSCAA